MTLTELLESGDLNGYEPGLPTWQVGLVPAHEIDGEVAANYDCPNCAVKCEYRPYVMPGSYRAFAVCPTCNRAEEF